MSKLINKFITTFKSFSLAGKALLIIGLFAFFESAITMFQENDNGTSASDNTLNSVISSIFGFLFGKHACQSFGSQKILIIFSFIISISCLIITVLAHHLNIDEHHPTAIEFRNLLFSSVGFLISQAKNDIDPD